MKGNAFETLNSDGDEAISQAEWDNTHRAIASEKYEEDFQAIDKDKNKRISYPEFSNYAEKYSNIDDAFMLLDKDKDGGLAPEEIDYVPSFRWITIHY